MGDYILYPSDFRNNRVVETLCAIVARDKTVCHYCETSGEYSIEERGRRPLTLRRIHFEIRETKFESVGRYLDELLHGSKLHRAQLDRLLPKHLKEIDTRLRWKPVGEEFEKLHPKEITHYEGYEKIHQLFSEILARFRENDAASLRRSAQRAIDVMKRRTWRDGRILGKSHWHCHSNGNPPSTTDLPFDPGFGFRVVISHRYEQDPQSKDFVVYGIHADSSVEVLYTHEECGRCR